MLRSMTMYSEESCIRTFKQDHPAVTSCSRRLLLVYSSWQDLHHSELHNIRILTLDLPMAEKALNEFACNGPV